jgi:hypothetical protein
MLSQVCAAASRMSLGISKSVIVRMVPRVRFAFNMYCGRRSLVGALLQRVVAR